MNPELPERLAARLREALPGPMVGSRFESRPRFGKHYDQSSPDARPAVVLVLLYPHLDEWFVPLTLRPANLASHPAEISLPGGAVEPGESGPQAAIREFHEELGAPELAIEILGRLSSLYVTSSNFLITPWVGAAAVQPAFTPNPAEVEQLLEVPLGHLCNPANLSSHQRQYHGRSYTAPHFAWQSHRIWGATCMILGELLTVLEGVRDEG